MNFNKEQEDNLMKTLYRVKPSEAIEIAGEDEILNVQGKWWRPKGILEVFPAGYVPVFIAFESSVTDIDDDDLVLVPKSREEAKYKSKNAFVCARAEKKEEMKKKYENAGLGWGSVSWNGLA